MSVSSSSEFKVFHFCCLFRCWFRTCNVLQWMKVWRELGWKMPVLSPISLCNLTVDKSPRIEINWNCTGQTKLTDDPLFTLSTLKFPGVLKTHSLHKAAWANSSNKAQSQSIFKCLNVYQLLHFLPLGALTYVCSLQRSSRISKTWSVPFNV